MSEVEKLQEWLKTEEKEKGLLGFHVCLASNIDAFIKDGMDAEMTSGDIDDVLASPDAERLAKEINECLASPDVEGPKVFDL